MQGMVVVVNVGEFLITKYRKNTERTGIYLILKVGQHVANEKWATKIL